METDADATAGPQDGAGENGEDGERDAGVVGEEREGGRAGEADGEGGRSGGGNGWRGQEGGEGKGGVAGWCWEEAMATRSVFIRTLPARASRGQLLAVFTKVGDPRPARLGARQGTLDTGHWTLALDTRN